MNFPIEIISESAEQTEALGAQLALALLDDSTLPRVVAFYGDLGVGKTVFVRGFSSVLAPEARVKSPTFALVNEYKSREKKLSLFHFDMYRIEDADDLYSIGFYEYLDQNGFCLIEWSENIQDELPHEVILVKIEKCGEDFPNRRKISICVRS